MKRPALFLTLALLTLVACQKSDDAPPPDGVSSTVLDLAPGWNTLEPGGETICSNGTPYAFYARPGDPQKLLIYFQGGGACWFGEICDLTMTPSYDPVVDAQDDPGRRAGLFDDANPENPFAGYSAVFVPYCTADVHVGNKVTTYPVAATDSTVAHEVTIQHKGYVNAMAALEWAFTNVTAPQTVFIAGSSAGAFPSAFYVSFVAERYPEARIAQLADGAGGYRGMDYALINEVWGITTVLPDFPEYEALTTEDRRLESYIVAAARRYPNIRFAQYNTAGDAIQLDFLRLAGITDTPLLPLLEANYADIRREVDNFRAFTAGGTVHTILTRPEFYTYAAGGVRFRDWIAALANGNPIDDVMCAPCETPALYQPPTAIP